MAMDHTSSVNTSIPCSIDWISNAQVELHDTSLPYTWYRYGGWTGPVKMRARDYLFTRYPSFKSVKERHVCDANPIGRRCPPPSGAKALHTPKRTLHGTTYREVTPGMTEQLECGHSQHEQIAELPAQESQPDKKPRSICLNKGVIQNTEPVLEWVGSKSQMDPSNSLLRVSTTRAV